MYDKRRRRQLSQNFFVNRELVKKLIGKSSIGKNDIVYDIGAGSGIITAELARIAKKVIAVEIDPKWYFFLKKRFRNTSNAEIHHVDFLKFKIKHKKYKIFANIPFHIEGEIIRKLLDGKYPPQDSYLVMLEDVAERLVGYKKEGLFSILHKPYFELSVIYRFRREDFSPSPKLDSVMLRARKCKRPIIGEEDDVLYKSFVRQGFGGGRRMDTNLRSFFSKRELVRLASEIGFSTNSKPSDLSFEQWMEAYNYFKKKKSYSY